MNAFLAIRLSGYIVLTGGVITLGAAFGQIGLIIAGVLLILLAAMLFNEAINHRRGAGSGGIRKDAEP